MSSCKRQSEISQISALELLDSRGFPTLSVTVTLASGAHGTACVPSGASTGEHEAHELRDADKARYMGKGVLKAVGNVREKIAAALRGMDAREQTAIDHRLIELDGSENKSELGANAILGVSLACAHAAANDLGIPLFRYIGGSTARRLPIPLINVINGGAHASNSLDFQEFMIVPHLSSTFFENIRAAAEIFQQLKINLKKKGLSVGIGDEGGFAPDLPNAEATLDTLIEAITDAGYTPGKEISLALDVAASEFYEKDSGLYVFKKGNGDQLTSQQLIDLYGTWITKYPLVSIEDGLDENDWAGWTKMTDQIGQNVQLVGDDLFVTNTKRLTHGLQNNAANAILIKLNQIGTLTETLEAIELAHKNSFSAIISHRSGETEDTSIADLAVATSAGQIKTGSVCRSERTAKYNRLLWIESFLAGEGYSINPFSVNPLSTNPFA